MVTTHAHRHHDARRLTISVLLASAVLGACAPPPTWDPRDRLPNDWGAAVIRPAAVDVAYDPEHLDRAHLADLYLPRRGPARGVIVYAHGGGFTAGSRPDLHRYAGPLLHELDRGFAVFNID